jgi:hypothetical protein
VPKGWAYVKIPLWGNAVWKKKEINPLDLARVDWIELHIATVNPKLTVWLDDIRFGADPRHQDRELVPDYDRAAAEYVVATKGQAEAWVSGKSVTIRAKSDIPSEPFKIVRIGYGSSGAAVTDVGLKLFGRLTDCREIYLPFSRITDNGIEHLTDMGTLERFQLDVSSVSGSALKDWRKREKLVHLGLRGSPLTDDAVAYIAAIPGLTSLDLSVTNMTDERLRRLRAHPTLTSITIWDNSGITEAGLRSLENLPAGLQYLAIDTVAAPNGIAFLEQMPLQTIGIKAFYTEGRVEPSLLESLQIFPELNALDVRSARIDAKTAMLISKLPNLTVLTIGSPWNGSGFVDSLKPLAAHPSLESLSISHVQIEGARLQGLAALTRLKSLDLFSGVAAEPADVLRLQAALPNCKITVSPEIQRAVDALRGGR